MTAPFYDLHLHSALSPCGDNDMTPNNIVNMALLKGLGLIALTDHNTARNCPALCAVARAAGLSAIAGMELCTAEEVHVVCLFPTVEAALAFDRYVDAHLPAIPNDPAIFGEQVVLDAQDLPVGRAEKLLINATTIAIGEVPALVRSYGGLCFPAHIDKSSNSILSNLGLIAPDSGFPLFEVADPAHDAAMRAQIPAGQDAILLHSSDAHYLWDISEAIHRLPAAALPLFAPLL